MAENFVLILGDLQGESKIKPDGKSNGIDLDSWSWGMSNPSSFHSGEGGGGGKVDVHDMAVTKKTDKCTPVLMQYCCSGKHYDKADLYCMKAGGDQPMVYMHVEMKKVFVTAVSPGSAGEELTEHVTLKFKEMTIDYTPQSDDGSAGGKVSHSWKIAENVQA